MNIIQSTEDTKELLNIPEGIIELPINPYKLEGVSNILFISDIHFPYHDKRAIDTALSYRDNWDCIILGGDIMDFYGLSRFHKRPDLPTIKEELSITNTFLDSLQARFPKARLIYMEGNHEARLSTFIMDKAPALFGCDFMKMESMLKLRERGIPFIENGQGIKVGSLNIIHGNESGMSGGVNVARSMMLKVMANVLFGHFHKSQEGGSKTLNNELIFTFSNGCLCGLKPRYMPMNAWNLGFATVDIYGNEFEVGLKKILPSYTVR